MWYGYSRGKTNNTDKEGVTLLIIEASGRFLTKEPF
jgi:hypothetical protein